MAGQRPAHLARRGAVYFVRFRIPNDLVDKLGLAEFRRSLQTHSSSKARVECLRATAWFRATMEELRRMTEPTRADLEEAARQYFGHLTAELDRPRGYSADPNRYDQEVAYDLDSNAERTNDLGQQLARNEFDGEVHRHAFGLVRLLGLDFDAMSVQQQIFACRLAVRAEIAEIELYRHQVTQPLARFEPSDELFRYVPQLVAAKPPASLASTVGRDSLRETMSGYLAGKIARGISHNQITELERAFGWLGEVAGSQARLIDVDRPMLRGFRNNLGRVDVRLRGQKLPFVHRLTDEAEHHIKYQTAVRYWKSVQSFFAWLTSEGLIDIDPAAGLTMERPKSVEQKSPEGFSEAELKKLFTTPVFSGSLSAQRPMTPGERRRRDGRWWFVLLAMHSGARAGELCQLEPSDFVFDAEVPYWKFRLEDGEGAKTKTLKNKASIRDVPIHPRLLELGLREFVQGRAKQAPRERLLREFRLGKGGAGG